MKSNIKTFQIILYCLFVYNFCFAQSESIRLFYHQNWDEKHKRKPKNQKKWQEFDLFARMYGKYALPEEKTLPLVFNFIDINNSDKVNEDLIMGQIDIINQAFAGEFVNNTGRDYSEVIAGDTKLRFCIGDPNGNISGINYKEKTVPYDLIQFEKISDKKDGLQGAKKDEYINIWITEFPDQMGGIAIMPDQDSLADGIYIDPDYFGVRPESEYYKEGKTIIHLLGQYLGLKPLWNLQDCFDDGVDDTPIHNGPNYNCYEIGEITLCSGNALEMIGNFMDATPDECAFMFTKGQMTRMHANLSEKGYRKNLLESKKICSQNFVDSNVRNREIIEKLDFNIIPNPTNNFIEVFYEIKNIEKPIDIYIQDIKGNNIYQNKIPPIFENKGRIIIDVSNFVIGNYFLTVSLGLEKVTKPFIKI